MKVMHNPKLATCIYVKQPRMNTKVSDNEFSAEDIDPKKLIARAMMKLNRKFEKWSQPSAHAQAKVNSIQSHPESVPNLDQIKSLIVTETEKCWNSVREMLVQQASNSGNQGPRNKTNS